MFASFQSDGISPDVMEWSEMDVRKGVILSAGSFSILVGIKSGPVDLVM
jgi:hypothetical protein